MGQQEQDGAPDNWLPISLHEVLISALVSLDIVITSSVNGGNKTEINIPSFISVPACENTVVFYLIALESWTDLHFVHITQTYYITAGLKSFVMFQEKSIRRV